MELDALMLARLQFAFTISFHIIFPAITIGLASYLVVLEGFWLKTRDATYLSLYQYWLNIFAVNFAMGVVSGLVMAYQFGTNWSGFSDFAGGITGPLLAYEVLTAFFLEAGFLGGLQHFWQRRCLLLPRAHGICCAEHHPRDTQNVFNGALDAAGGCSLAGCCR